MKRTCHCDKPECGACKLFNDHRYGGLLAGIPDGPYDPPGILTKGANLAAASWNHLMAGLPKVDEDTYYKRLETCEGCPWRAPGWECNACGCKLLEKAWWGEQKCPVCSTCGRKEEEHGAVSCPEFKPKWAASLPMAAMPQKKGCCG